MRHQHSPHSLREINTRTLYLSLVLGVAFFIPNVYAALSTNSLALWTNCLLSVGYIIMSCISLVAYKMAYSHKLERRINLFLAMFFLMIISIIWFNIYLRLQQALKHGPLSFALILLSTYIILNSYMFFRTHYYGTIEKSNVMLTQANIYLIKLSLNITIISSLILSNYFSTYHWAKYFDPCCSLILSIFILSRAKELYNKTR